jgi:hypothetical protein
MVNDHPLLKRKMQFFLITALFIIFTAAVIVFFLVNVRIQTVEVKNCLYSGEETVLKAANIKPGTHSYGIDKAKISKNIKSASPYVTDVRIKRTGIHSVEIILTEDAPRFYIEREGKYVLLSEKLRVLASFESRDEFAHLPAYPILLMPVKEAEIGKTIVFEENGKRGDKENPPDLSILDGEDALDILTKISESALSGTITHADISERFDLRFTYKDKYEIRFGAPREFSEKLALVIKTIAYLENPENGYSQAKGIIHASVIGETSFEPTGAAEETPPPDNQENPPKNGNEPIKIPNN